MTELEGCVLGVVSLRGPCTAYVVRREFLVSESPHWSGSAGAIYPLLRRLEQQKLIRSRSHAWGSGTKKMFAITSRGRAELRAWIGPPLPQWTAKPTFDPVRTRMSFLVALSPAKRARFIAVARENNAREMAQLREKVRHLDRQADPFEYLVSMAVLHEARARARWLRYVAKELNRLAGG